MDIEKKIIKINHHPIDEPKQEKEEDKPDHHDLDTATKQPEPIQIKRKIMKSPRKGIKSILLAAISSITIGLVFGFVLLNMLTSFNNHSEVNQSTPVITDDHSSITTPSGKQYTLESMSAYVVQGGVFSSEKNAKEQALELEKETNFKTVIWERDQQYYLFVGIANNEQQAKNLTRSKTNEDLSLYVKSWEVQPSPVSLLEEEFTWLQSFQQIWNESLIKMTNHEALEKENWEKLLDQSPSSETIQPLINQINDMIKEELPFSDQSEAQYQLLLLWNQFEQL